MQLFRYDGSLILIGKRKFHDVIQFQVEEIGHEVSSTASGDYFRLLLPGTYTITVAADGYEKSSQQVEYR